MDSGGTAEAGTTTGVNVNQRAIAVAAWESLFRAQVSVMRQLTAEFPRGELTLGEYDVLFTLSTQPDRRLRAHQLNEHLLLTQPSISRMTDRLVLRGLVSKSADPEDGRVVIVGLTDNGFTAFRRAAASHMESISRRVGGALETHELLQLTVLADKLRLGGS